MREWLWKTLFRKIYHEGWSDGAATNAITAIKLDRARIIEQLTTDAVISTNMPIEQLEIVVAIVEGEKRG